MRQTALVAVLMTLCIAFAATWSVGPGSVPRTPVAASAITRIVPMTAPIASPSPDVAAGGQWTFIGTQAPARDGHGFVYDSRANRFVLFGGETVPGVFTNSTWTYDAANNTWANVTPVVGPSPRIGFGMTYDSGSDRVVLFGGQLGTAALTNDTWLFDLANDTWTNVTRPMAPTARVGPSMAYNASAGVTILFGGYNGTGSPGDTWAYHSPTNNWSVLTRSGPIGRFGGSMVYDSFAQKTVLFGGVYEQGASYALLSDTWTFDWVNNAWTLVLPYAHPSSRFGAAMAYDSASGKSVLFGGTSFITPGGTTYNDTWIYEASQGEWSELLPAAGPSPRFFPAMDYDAVADRIFLFGGAAPGGPISEELWAYAYAPGVPSAPGGPFLIPQDGQIIVIWAAPPSDGGSPITAYRLYRGTSPGGETLRNTLPGDLYILTDGALTDGVTYYYQLTAVNAAGESPRSVEASATPHGPPTPPRNLAATAGNGNVTLTWGFPTATGGYPSLTFRILRGTASGGEANLTTVGNVTRWVDVTVTPGQAYYYQVVAVNPTGDSARSGEVSATPLPAGAPSAPRSPAAVGGPGRIDLTWTAPSSTGSSGISGYKVYRGAVSGGETLIATLGTVLAYRDTAVTIGRAYYYEVTAVNGAGEGLRSSEVSALALEATPPSITVDSPGNHTVLTSTKATVSGTASDDTSVQKVELSTDGTTWALATGTTSWTGNVTLVPGNNTIYIRATDSVGNARVVSITVTLQPPSPPPQGVDPLIVAGAGFIVVVAVLAAVLLLWRRRKKPTPPPPGSPPPDAG